MNEHIISLVEAGRKLGELGFCHAGTGNMSIFADGKVYASPSGCSLAELQCDEVSVVAPDGTLLSGRKPTKELPFHLAAYRSDGSAHAVIHLHTIYSSLVSCMGRDFVDMIERYTPYAAMKAGPVAYIPYHSPGSPELGDEVAARPDAGSYILANHGMIVKGRDIWEALAAAEELEFSSELAWRLRNEEHATFLAEDEIARLRRR